MDRVIYCLIGCAAMLSHFQHTELTSLGDGGVAAIGDPVLLGLYAQYPALPILYFARPAYDEAVRDLPPVDRDEALQKRLKEWSPQALEQTIDWIYRGEREALSLTILAGAGEGDDRARALAAHGAGTIELLTGLVGEGRYDEMDLADLIVVAIEKEALIRTELQAAGAAGARADAEGEIGERRRIIEALAAAAAALGRPEFAQAPPYAELWRATYIEPADSQLLEALTDEWEPFVPWRQGIVARYRVRQIDDLKRSGRRVGILCFDAGLFLEDVAQLSPAQLRRGFEERAQAMGAARQGLWDTYMDGLRLESLLALRWVVARMKGGDEERDRMLVAVESMAGARLVSSLRRSRSWLSSPVGPGPEAAGRLLEREQQLVADAALFSALAARQGQTELAQRLLGILARKQADVMALKSLSGDQPQ
jgi:hypothetical protein